MNYDTFKKKWLGSRINADGVYGFQCVDLIKQYAKEVFNISHRAWGNAIDYWYSTSPDLTTKFSRVATKSPRKGDIIIFKGVSGNPYGHIGIADSNSGAVTVATLEQNGSTGNGSGIGGDRIRVRKIAKWRIVGVLRPKAAKPVTKMPAIGSKITLPRGDVRTTFKAGSTRIAGYIRPVADWSYTVRGYDPRYPNRILINSRSGGGNGVSLALYYHNGKRIEGWK